MRLFIIIFSFFVLCLAIWIFISVVDINMNLVRLQSAVHESVPLNVIEEKVLQSRHSGDGVIYVCLAQMLLSAVVVFSGFWVKK